MTGRGVLFACLEAEWLSVRGCKLYASKTIPISALAMSFLLWGPTVWAQSPPVFTSNDMRINPSTILQHAPTIVVDPYYRPNGVGAVYVIYVRNDSTNTDVQFTRSLDGGLSWSPPRTLDSAAGLQGNPHMAVDQDCTADGTLWAVWTDNSSSFGGRRIMVSVSGDRGMTWSSPEGMVDPGSPGPILQRHPHIVAKDNKASVVWSDTRNQSDPTHRDIMMACSSSQPPPPSVPQFDPPFALNDPPLGARPLAVSSIDESLDRVHVAWTESATSGDNILFSSSNTFCQFFPPPPEVVVPTNGIPTRRLNPNLEANGTDVWVAYEDTHWFGTPPTLSGITFQRSADSGATWGQEVLIDPSYDGTFRQFGPTVTLTFPTIDDITVNCVSDLPAPLLPKLYAGWVENRNSVVLSELDFVAASSNDGGNNWSSLSALINDVPKSVRGDSGLVGDIVSNQVWAAWTDFRDGVHQIYVDVGQ